MNYTDILNDESFHYWNLYGPADPQYARFAENEPWLIAAGHKIEDVYFSFCNARASLLDAGINDFSGIPDEISKLFAKTHYLTNALMEYALCLDISWQVVWAYSQPASFAYLVKQEYKKMESECTRENLIEQLNCVISQKSEGYTECIFLRDLIIDFDRDQDVQKMRQIYNSMKHRGVIHFEEFGEYEDVMEATVDGCVVPILTRTRYKISDIEELIYAYHFKFEKYFNSIVQKIMPEDYNESSVTFQKYRDVVIQMYKIYYDR